MPPPHKITKNTYFAQRNEVACLMASREKIFFLNQKLNQKLKNKSQSSKNVKNAAMGSISSTHIHVILYIVTN